MTDFKLVDVAQYSHPRWPLLSDKESLILLGYAYGRVAIQDSSVTLASVGRRNDLVMAVFCCGGTTAQIEAAIRDYVLSVRHFLTHTQVNPNETRKALAYTYDALLLLLTCDGRKELLHPLADLTCALANLFKPQVPADAELILALKVICGCLGVNAFRELSESGAVSTLLQGALTHDVELFRDGLHERFKEAFRYASPDESLSPTPNLLEKAVFYYRFGRGLVHAGHFEVAKRLGMNVDELRSAKEVRPYVEVF